MGEQLPSLFGEQAQRELSLVAVFGDNAPINAHCCSSQSSRSSPRQYTQPMSAASASASASATDHEDGGEIGARQIDLIGAPLTASQPPGTGAGGSGLGPGTGGDHRARRPDRLSDRCRGTSLLMPAPGFTAKLAD